MWAEGPPERPFRTPNWGAFDEDGAYYLTDSGGWGASDGLVWRIPRGGAPEVWTEEVRAFPNGLCLSADGSKLYVLESYPGALVEVPILADGSAGDRRLLCDLDPAVPDGVALTVDGAFLIACYRPDAVLRWHPRGRARDARRGRPRDDPRGAHQHRVRRRSARGAIVPNIGRWHLTRIPLASERRSAVLSTRAVSERIESLHVTTVRAALPEPIHFGDWVMKHREFALVRARAESGNEGFGFTLTREGPVAATIHQAIAHHYVGSEVATPGRRGRDLLSLPGLEPRHARRRHGPARPVDRRPRRPRPARTKRRVADLALARRRAPPRSRHRDHRLPARAAWARTR